MRGSRSGYAQGKVLLEEMLMVIIKRWKGGGETERASWEMRMCNFEGGTYKEGKEVLKED